MIRDFNINFNEKEISSIYQKIKDYPWNSIQDLEGWEHGTNKAYLKEFISLSIVPPKTKINLSELNIL